MVEPHELPAVGCRAEGLLMFVRLSIFRVTRQASAPKRQLRIPPAVTHHIKIVAANDQQQ